MKSPVPTSKPPTALSWDDCALLVSSIEGYAIFLLDPDGHVLTWNRGAELIKGYSAGEIVGRHFSAFYSAEDVRAGKPERNLRAAAEHGRVEDEGFRMRKDGSPFWAHVVITAIRDASGALRGFGKVTADLTARRQREEELRRAEQRFHLLVDGISDYAIYMLDPSGRISTWNEGARRSKGYEASEIIGRHFSTFYTEEDVRAGKPERVLQSARETGRYVEEGYRVRRDGTRFWASIVLTALRDEAGDLIGFAKVTRDLTERRAAEETARELVREQATRAAAVVAEARIQQNEQRYRELSARLEAILEGIQDGITVQDASGRVVFANQAGARMCGLTSVDELLSVPSGEVVHRFEMTNEDGKPFPLDALPGRRALRGERPEPVLMRVRERATGREWWSSIRSSAVLGTDGKPALAINIMRDVTSARRREQYEKFLTRATSVLASSLDYEEMLLTLASLLVPGVADWCAVHLLEGENLVNVAVWHAVPEKLARAQALARRRPPAPDRLRALWNVIRNGASELYAEVTDELLVAHAEDAEQLAVLRELGMKSAILAPIRVRERVIGTLSIATAESGRRYDTEDVRLLEELGRRAGIAVENARLYAAERSAREHVAVLARAGAIFASSMDYETTLQNVVRVTLPVLGDFAFLDVLEGRRVRRIAEAFEDPEADALLENSAWMRAERADADLDATFGGAGPAARGEAAERTEVATSPEQLELFEKLGMSSTIRVPLRTGTELFGALTVCFGRSGRRHGEDDTRLAAEIARRAAIAIEHARLYQASRDAVRSAEDASRVKDEFLATVSHELRTPLNAILGWSTLLVGRGLEPALKKPIDVIHRNAKAQQRIIEDILDVSRIITGKLQIDPKPTDLIAVTRDAIEVVRPSVIAKRITVDLDAEAPALLVADPERLQQAIWNLLSNAVKFSEVEGRITVVLRRKGSRLVLSVSDTGKGIEPEFLPFVFDRFKQADGSTTRRYGGLGLGLALVRHIVELHGGSVAAESAGLGLGATFTIELPVRAVVPPLLPEQRPSSPDAATPAPPEHGALSGVRILVVDDDADALELLRVVLRDAGAEVETASSAAAGFASLRRSPPDLVVSDVGMPDEDGYSFMTRVRALPEAEGGGTPSVALTAYTRDRDRDKARDAGFTAHLSKPVNPDDLVTRIARLLASGRGI